MSVSSRYVCGSYTHDDLMFYSTGLIKQMRAGRPLHTIGLRTWLETMPIPDHYTFAAWLIKQDGVVMDAWLRLARSGTSSPWLRPLMDELSMEVQANG